VSGIPGLFIKKKKKKRGKTSAPPTNVIRREAAAAEHLQVVMESLQEHSICFRSFLSLVTH
jgi:hypothetical protein